jgi:8-oxo-dGTP pyrophosphatase MutT (NUDIX family)
MVLGGPVAVDGQVLPVESHGQSWLVSWAPPGVAPAGRAHGVNAFCVAGADSVALISRDGEHWGWPGGRPEPGESSYDTLKRETLEEVCAQVRQARLLGFTHSRCVRGAELGLILVRSIWRAEVDLLPWEPRFEIGWRRVVAAADLGEHLWMEEGHEPIFRRALLEAGLA